MWNQSNLGMSFLTQRQLLLLPFYKLQFTFSIILYYFQMYSIAIRPSSTLQSTPPIFQVSVWPHMWLLWYYWLYSACFLLNGRVRFLIKTPFTVLSNSQLLPTSHPHRHTPNHLNSASQVRDFGLLLQTDAEDWCLSGFQKKKNLLNK